MRIRLCAILTALLTVTSTAIAEPQANRDDPLGEILEQLSPTDSHPFAENEPGAAITPLDRALSNLARHIEIGKQSARVNREYMRRVMLQRTASTDQAVRRLDDRKVMAIRTYEGLLTSKIAELDRGRETQRTCDSPEPKAVLDSSNVQRCEALIRSLTDSAYAVEAGSHDLEIAMQETVRVAEKPQKPAKKENFAERTNVYEW